MTVHSLLALCLALGLTLVLPGITSATDLPLYGGSGGQQVRAECPKGSYLVGLAGRAGSWVDRIAPVCAPWLRGSQALGTPTIGQSFGMSGGGQEQQTICTRSGNNRLAIQSWWTHLLRSDNHYVQYIEMYCDSLPTPLPPTNYGPRLDFGTRPNDVEELVTYGPFSSQPPFQACPAGEAAVGIRVRAGQFVDAIGLICGPRPLGPSTPAMKLPGPLVQVPSPAVTINPQAKNTRIAPDMFVITKPIPGQLIPHGKLIVTATAPEAPPTKGPPRYAELELRYLDAPANQQFSYPYFHVITVDEVKLRGGYPVAHGVTAPNSTAPNSGRWQVRARFSLNTAIGPWSAPVPFGLCHVLCPATPPSAIQQTAPLPSSSIMQSAPSSQKSTSSSLMIRPRGADEKTGNQGKAAGGSPEAEKTKP